MVALILYVEDNRQNMDLVCRILRHVGGYDVLGAETGTHGISVALSEEPDLIIMDINLPDMSGLEATQLIKATPHLAHIPVVAFTADTGESERQHYIDSGCDGYMAKPANAQILLDTVSHYLN